MDAEFWHQRWQLRQIGFHQATVNCHLADFWTVIADAVAPAGKVFVPLCGKSLDMLWLRERGHGVIGVELSAIAAREFFADNALPVETEAQPPFVRYGHDGLDILQGDFFALTPVHLDGCRLFYDRASLIALPPPMREQYAAHMATLLPAGAEGLLVTLEYDQSRMEGPPFSVSMGEVHRLFDAGFVVEALCATNVTADNARFRDRGVPALYEKAYRLRRR